MPKRQKMAVDFLVNIGRSAANSQSRARSLPNATIPGSSSDH
jgi:hypothetical protein